MRKSVFALVCLLFSIAPAVADDWLKAMMLFDAGRYDQALEIAAPFAEDGNFLALEMLYASYTYGYGVPIDHVKAMWWLKKAADLGDAASQDAMGHHYFDGIGVGADAAEAMRWFRLAAQQGYAPAIYSLGIMTMHGQGIEADSTEARRLMQRAAELDNPDALFLMGGVAMQNAVATGSIDTAMDYFTRAAQLGQRQASAMLGVILEDFVEVPDHRMKSAFHYRMAVAAGCTDTRKPAARAVARLSPEELQALEDNLALWAPDIDPRDPQPVPGQYLAG